LADALKEMKATTFASAERYLTVATTNEIAVLARQVLEELSAAREAGEDLHRERRGIGAQLRLLLTMTDALSGESRQPRVALLKAIRRTEIGDEIRRGGACHIAAERSIQLPEDTDLDGLADGLRQLAELGDDAT
jgi:hypothetical protein